MKAKKLIMKLIDKHLEFVPLRGLAAADAAAAGRGRGAELAAVPGPLPLLPPTAGQDGVPLWCQVCTVLYCTVLYSDSWTGWCPSSVSGLHCKVAAPATQHTRSEVAGRDRK